MGWARHDPIEFGADGSMQRREDCLKMARAVAITHVGFEDLGTLEAELKRAGFLIEVFEAATADLKGIAKADPDLVIVLGGPIGVYDREAYPFLDAEVELIRRRLIEKRPTLGICLGAQLIAAAAGASVFPGANGKEIGWSPIQAAPGASRYPEFKALFVPGVRVLHWHGDTFDLPAGAELIAGTDAYANQAFAIGEHILGLQFHPEVTAQGLERWYIGHACELASASISVSLLRQESETFAPALESAARELWRGWLARLGA
jgi:GMP synthase (glutamine-hydrolysing)